MTCQPHKSFSRRAGQFCVRLIAASGVAYSAAVFSADNVHVPYVELDVPFVPTPTDVVEKMLELADVQSSDFLIDLGSGDGRIAIAAVRDRGARGAFGVDIDPTRVEEARANAEHAGVADKVTFEIQDLFETDLTTADVISMYLLPDVNMRLRPTILELEPGTRIVSHAFDMGTWYADNHVRVDNRDVYLWVVPANVEGQWKVSANDGEFTIDVQQEFQNITGTAALADQQEATVKGQLRGTTVYFDVDDGAQTTRYVGSVTGDTIEMIPDPGAQSDWRAEKL